MAPANPSTREIPSDDELDDILNGVLAVGDISATIDTQTSQDVHKQPSAAATAALGLDKTIEVDQVKKRAPIPKLDDARLLSAAGIPKLRKISKERLKLKGKGHEYGDIARMLNMYQLWLDDLYPRAKFADGLAMIEKLGHTKRIQYMRKEWINEGKPNRAADSEAENNEVIVPEKTVEQDAERMEGVESGDEFGGNGIQAAAQEDPSGQMDHDVRVQDDGPDEDELDALLAEADMPNTVLASTTLRPKVAAPREDDFDDDMEALAEMDGMW